MHTNSMDEAYALPSEKAVRIALRTQQIIAEETNVVNTVDPLGGYYYVEWLTNKMEEEAYAYFDRIAALGGVIPAIRKGFFQKEIAKSAYRYQKDIDEEKRKVVGVNCYKAEEEVSIPLLKLDEKGEMQQISLLQKVKEERDNGKVEKALTELRKAAEGEQNLMPYILDAVRVYATLGETCGVLREVFGEYEEPIVY